MREILTIRYLPTIRYFDVRVCLCFFVFIKFGLKALMGGVGNTCTARRYPTANIPRQTRLIRRKRVHGRLDKSVQR